MILVAGGCSFIYGSELADAKEFAGFQGYSMKTYPALLAQSMRIDYKSVAYPGNANNAIARYVINQCQQLKDNRPMVIVQWSFSNRYEFRFAYSTNHIPSPWYSVNVWDVSIDKEWLNEGSSDTFKTVDEHERERMLNHYNNAQKLGITDFSRSYIKNIAQTEYWEVYTSLKEIVFLQLFLKANNIPYIFTSADDRLLYNNTILNMDLTLNSLYSQIDWDNWVKFPSIPDEQLNINYTGGFYQWSQQNNFKFGCTHPLEDAHTAATKLIQGKFYEMVKKLV